MSKKEDDDKVRMSQCEKKSVVIQGIKDRSQIRRYKVTRKQGCGDEGGMKSKRRKARKDLETGVHETKGRSWGDPGKIHRSKGFGVQGCWRKYGKGDKEGRCWRRGQGYEGEGERRTRRGSGVRMRQGR